MSRRCGVRREIGASRGLRTVFLSTVEKQLDAKRRIVLPQEFRATAQGAFDGVFCFPSIEADCIEGGGQALLDTYRGIIDELAFGDPLRGALETTVYGGMVRLAYDPAGRIILPEGLCEAYGLIDHVCVVGKGDRFEIWSRDAFRAERQRQMAFAREHLGPWRTAKSRATAGAAA